MKTICVDLGNTRKKAAILEDGAILQSTLLENDGMDQISELIKTFHPSKSILSSVIHHDKRIEILLSDQTQFHMLQIGRAHV